MKWCWFQRRSTSPRILVSHRLPKVFRSQTGIWRCLYQGKPRAEPQKPRYSLLLESDDGLHWQAPP